MGLELKVSERGRLSKGAGQRRGLGKGGGWAKEGAGQRWGLRNRTVRSACPRGRSGSFYRDLPRGHGPCPHAVEGPALVL